MAVAQDAHLRQLRPRDVHPRLPEEAHAALVEHGVHARLGGEVEDGGLGDVGKFPGRRRGVRCPGGDGGVVGIDDVGVAALGLDDARIPRHKAIRILRPSHYCSHQLLIRILHRRIVRNRHVRDSPFPQGHRRIATHERDVGAEWGLRALDRNVGFYAAGAAIGSE